MQPVFRAVSTSCHAGRGLAGHPWCVRVGNGSDKTRLYTPIHSKTTAHRASTVCSPPQCAVRMLKSTVRLLQPLLPRTQKRQWPVTYSRSQTPESRPGKKVIEEDHLEADPLANMPRGLVHVAGSKRRLLSYPGSLSSQMILEIRFRGGGVSIQGSSVCTVPGSSHYYAMHGCGSLPSVTDGNLHSGPVRGSFNIAQDPPPQPLKLPRAQDQLCLEHTVTQSMSIVPGHSYRLQMTATVSVERVTTIQRHAASFKEGTAHLFKAFKKMMGLMAEASPVLQLGLLRMRPIQFWLKQRVPSAAWHHGRHCITVTRACVSAPACWRDLLWLKQGGILDTAHRRNVVMTDASNKG